MQLRAVQHLVRVLPAAVGQKETLSPGPDTSGGVRGIKNYLCENYNGTN